MKRDFMFTSVSVTEGHPDKLCDQVSDALVDRFLTQDPLSRIITECAVSKGVMFIAARFASSAKVDIPDVARRVIHRVGYREGEFSAKDCAILTSIAELPSSEAITTDERHLNEEELDSITAKHQVTVFGFACTQTPALMPLPIWLAHRLARQLTAARQEQQLPYLSPDGMTQVGIAYRDGRPYRIHSITLITSQSEAGTPNPERSREDLMENVIKTVFAHEPIGPDRDTHIFMNPDGPIVGGGPARHSGMTGRKNAIDTYGEYARQSGAALSGKDPSRIDRVGAYAARYAAKNVVAAGLAEACEVQLSYTIGLSRPVSIQVETFGTGKADDDEIARRVEKHFDFRVGGIVREFDLRSLPSLSKRGFYSQLAAYGQVGRDDLELPWERTDKAPCLKDFP